MNVLHPVNWTSTALDVLDNYTAEVPHRDITSTQWRIRGRGIALAGCN